MGLVRALTGLNKRLAENRASYDNADAYGRLPIPGSVRLTLQAGDVKLWYHEARKASRSGDRIDDLRPRDLEVTVAPGGSGPALEIHGPGWRGMGRQVKTQAGWTIDLHGTVHVVSPGEYTVAVNGTPAPDAVEPQLLLGS